MKEIIKRKKITLNLKFSEMYDDDGEFSGGGVLHKTNHVDSESWLEIMENPVYNVKTDIEAPSGIKQVHFGCTRRAMKELGAFLLAYSQFTPKTSDFRYEFFLVNEKKEPTAILVVHLPVDLDDWGKKFPQVHFIYDGDEEEGDECMDEEEDEINTVEEKEEEVNKDDIAGSVDVDDIMEEDEGEEDEIEKQ